MLSSSGLSLTEFQIKPHEQERYKMAPFSDVDQS